MRRWLAMAGLALAVLAALAVVRLDRRVRTYLAGPALGGTRIYAAPAVVEPGTRLSQASLVADLARLGYVEATRASLVPGEFRKAGDGLALHQRHSIVPWGSVPRHARVVFGAGVVGAIEDLDGGPAIPRLELRPELLAVGGVGRTRLEAATESVPPLCRDAVLAAEDRHFFRHPGVDPIAVVRALVANLRSGERRQGASTVTQQLAKNAFLSPRRTFGRKAREVVLAFLLEAHASKEDILRRYLASVYLGHDGGVPVHGLAHGAAVHLGRPLAALDAGDCALLAGMIQAPNRLAPRRHPEAAARRRDQVLDLMVESGALDAAAARAAKARPLRPAPPGTRPVGALYVADEVQREIDRLLPREVSRSPGLAVYTDVDAGAQREAERAVRHGLEALERRRPRRDGRRLEAALVALDPETGHVRALVGGRDYRSSPLDRALGARRQPGSTFKPFVYLAALDPSRRGRAALRTVVSPVEDGPLALRVGKRLWRPANYDDTVRGTVPLDDAVADSINTATVRVAVDVGVDRIAETAHDLGITSALPRVPALALGAGETSLLELTAAYAVFASGGVRRAPTLVTAVTAADGELLWAARPEDVRVLLPEVAYLMTYLLERVVDHGTGRGARAAGLRGPAAGKTGTTDDTRDAWFVGYTPDLVAGVWVGLDRGGPTGFTGAAAALPIWTDFVRAASDGDPTRAFPVPPSIVFRDVDPATGLLATGDCPAVRRVPFLAGSEPRRRCDRHAPMRAAVGRDAARPPERAPARERGSPLERFGRWLGGIFR